MQVGCLNAHAWGKWFCYALSKFSPWLPGLWTEQQFRVVSALRAAVLPVSRTVGQYHSAQALVSHNSSLVFFVHCGPHMLPSWRWWQSDWSHCTSTLPLLVFVALALQDTLKMSGLPFTPSLGPYRCAVFCQQCTAPFFVKLRYSCWSRDKDKCWSGVIVPHFMLALGRHSH